MIFTASVLLWKYFC